ncbi:MAG: DUF3568 family protein [Syntrophales bacterium]
MPKSLNPLIVVMLVLSALLVLGCDTAFMVGGKTVGISDGQFISKDGYLTMEYDFSLEDIWKACEQTISDMNASEVEKNRKIASGKITGTIQAERIVIAIEYISKEITWVSIRVGIAGNNMVSQIIHEKIGNNLLKLKK